MTQPLDFVIDEMRERGLVYWQLKRASADKKPLCEQDNAIGIDQSLTKLERKLKSLGGGIYTLLASPYHKVEGRKNMSEQRIFQIELTNSKAVAAPNPMAYHTPAFETLQHQLLDLERGKLRAEIKAEILEDRLAAAHKRIAELEQEISETEEEEESIGGFKMSQLLTLLLNQNQAAPAPVNSPNINGPEPELINVFQAWHRLDPDAPAIARRCIEIIKTDPKQYNFYKAALIKKA